MRTLPDCPRVMTDQAKSAVSTFKKTVNVRPVAVFMHQVENYFRSQRDLLGKSPGKDTEIIPLPMLPGSDQVHNDIVFKESADAIIKIGDKPWIQTIFGTMVVETLVNSSGFLGD